MILIFSAGLKLNAQALPDVLTEGTLQEQYDYLTDRTNIYNNFRAIREDMFRTISRNSLDSLNAAYSEINSLEQTIGNQRATIDSLNISLEEISADRDMAIRDRDSLSFLGLPIKKTIYNIILWSIIAALAALLAIIYLLFRNARHVTRKTTSEMNELQTEYDEYRKNSRERFEKQSIDHFNEIKKLKGL
jgi:hypothetical protein